MNQFWETCVAHPANHPLPASPGIEKEATEATDKTEQTESSRSNRIKWKQQNQVEATESSRSNQTEETEAAEATEAKEKTGEIEAEATWHMRNRRDGRNRNKHK